MPFGAFDSVPKRLLICGTRSLAAEVADLVSVIPEFELVGFVENLDRERCSTTLEGLPIYWVDDLADMAGDHVAVCALGTTHRSRFTQQVEKLGVPFATVVHPSAQVSPRSSLGDGTIVGVGAIVGARTSIGRHVFINRGVLIGHHTVIGDHVSIMPGANIAGNCRIDDAAFIGIGAVVVNNVTVGSHSAVGAGAVVTKDVPPNVQVVGVPARVIKQNISGE
jgi:sugar O-acyltransferase (sialic acid O-acetyltransferase NeuD family)